MIDAKELRVGNKVLSDRCIVTVKYINEHLTVTTKQGNDISARMGLIKAIELTPEILERAGFKMSITKTCYGLITEDGKDRFSIFSDGRFKVHATDISIEVKYLHQLQNLYYALTGTELEVNLQ